MTYKGVYVTHDNFREVFKDYSRDIQDEIELAIIHGVDVSNYVRDCREDFNKLGEIRKALEDGVPFKYISVVASSKTLYIVRQGIKKGRDMSSLLHYYSYSLCKISADLLDRLAEAVYNGVDIQKVDFLKLPVELFDSVIHGLSKGYPMQFITESKIPMTPSYVNILMKALLLGIDITPFTEEAWEEGVLMLLLSNARNMDISDVLTYITPRFSGEYVQYVIEGIKNNVGQKLRKLCMRDKLGNPVFNIYQADVLLDALVGGYPYDDIFNPNLADVEMRDRLVSWRNNIIRLSHAGDV